MEHFKEYLIIKGKSKSTVQSYLNMLSIFKQWIKKERLEEEEINYRDVLAYVKNLQNRGLKQITIQNYLNTLNHYFIFLKDEQQLISDNPIDQVEIKGIKKRNLYDLFSREELDGIYHDYEGRGIAGVRNKVILGFMIYQGLGTGDIGKLTTEDLKLREGKIYVSGSRKSNERDLELKPFQIIEIQEYIYQVRPQFLSLSGKESNILFVRPGEGEGVKNAVNKLMQQLKKKYKRLKNVKQLRASVITDWLKVHNLRKTQYLAGHRFVSSTEKYEIGNLEDLQAEINNYHPTGR